MDILETHTEGQLVVMSVASRIQYERMKGEVKSGEGLSTSPLAVQPPKPFNKMTAEELELYYNSVRSGTMQNMVKMKTAS